MGGQRKRLPKNERLYLKEMSIVGRGTHGPGRVNQIEAIRLDLVRKPVIAKSLGMT